MVQQVIISTESPEKVKPLLRAAIDFIGWSGEIQMLRLLEEKHRTLAGAQIN